MCSHVFAPRFDSFWTLYGVEWLPCGVATRNSAPIPSNTRNRISTQVAAIWLCIKSYNKKIFVEMIFHFLLTNDLFHRRGQKVVPIHVCNYKHWDTFLTKFYTFCSKCAIEPFFTRFFLHYSVMVRIFYFLGKFQGIFFFETLIRRRFFLWIFS